MHGISYSDDQWKRLGIVTAADHLISTGVIPPVVIIMPYNYDWRQPDESNFGLVVTNVLVPWVDENYHTLADREHRAIGGLSRGAGWAVHLGLTRWDLFSRIGAHSLSLLRVDESKLDDLFSAVPEDQKPEFYLDAGNQDPELVNIDHFIQQLETRKFPYQWSINPGTHNENYWGAHVTEYLLWYVQQW